MSSTSKTALIAVCSVAAGVINSLLGAGGGVLLSLTLPLLTAEAFPDRRDVYVNSQAAMIPGCALSCIVYSMKGMLDTAGFSLLAIPAAVGGAVGSLMLSRIKVSFVQALFAMIVIWSGIRMMMG